MAYVDANKALSDPRKVGRLYYLLEPMLTRPIVFKAKSKRCAEILDRALEVIGNKRITGALKSYRYLNEAVYKRLGSIDAEKTKVIFMTSKSVDPSSSPICVDIFSEHCVLGDRLLELETGLYSEFDKSGAQIMYFPVAPVLFPAVTAYENKEVMFKFPFPEAIKEVNEKMTGGKQVSHISLERRLGQDLEGQKGIYQFKTLLFETAAAKAVFIERDGRTLEEIKEQEIDIEDSCYVNRVLMGNAFKNICKETGLSKPIPLYSEESGYPAQIFDAGSIERTTFGQVTRNMSGIDARLGLCSPAALSILKSYVYKVRYG